MFDKCFIFRLDEKMPAKKNLKKGGFILPPNLRD